MLRNKDKNSQEEAREEAKAGKGIKFDKGKVGYGLVSPIGFHYLALVYEYGRQKYDAHQYRKGMKWSKVVDAALRHIFSVLLGEWNDQESGLPHLAHAAWNCITLLEYNLTHPNENDLYKFEVDLIEKLKKEWFKEPPIKLNEV